ncbi:hypothetical protein [Sulfurospirillum arcachonense]|uniref:hypothetical protein n=1 Tax=Sulfurospirillum arcachonense TaxID=57666 RepID=UPI0004688A10|nr:hypothetical protein [Sulfurospirillum arcachonense]
MSQNIQLFLIILIFLEIFELFWQRGKNFRDYVGNLFYFYKKGVIFFILLHPSLYFVIFAQMSFQNYSFLSSLLILIKFLDISFKMSLMDKIYKKKDLGAFAPLLKANYPLSIGIKGAGLIIYPTIFFFAFN